MPVFTLDKHTSQDNGSMMISRVTWVGAAHHDEIVPLRKNVVANPNCGKCRQHFDCLVLTGYLCASLPVWLVAVALPQA